MIRAIEYDEAAQELRVTWNNGSEGVYSGVPRDDYIALISASSVGKKLNETIKGRYPYQRL
jgi:hypothetical protein